MKKAVKPRIKPSQRMKKRYLLFHYAAGKKVQLQGIKGLIKALGIPSISLIEFDSASGNGIARCARADLAMARKTFNEVGLRTLKVSGSLRKLRQKP